MTYGYSLKLAERNKAADKRHLGVRLGRACIQMEIPVSTVAKHFKVTRQTIYNWFAGVATPSPEQVPAIEKYIYGLRG